MSRLLDEALDSIDRLGEPIEKQAFEPMPAGGDPAAMAPPMDPAMMDPAMAGMDPTAAGAGPAASSPPPAAANVPPAAPSSGMPPEMHDMIVGAVRQVMQEMGTTPGGGGGEGGGAGKPAQDMEARLGAVEGALAQVLEMMGLASPQAALSEAVTSAAPAAAGMSSGAGTPDSGADAEPMPAMGPMSPGAPDAFGGVDVPSTMGGMKVSHVEAPLDKSTNATNVINAVSELRKRKQL